MKKVAFTFSCIIELVLFELHLETQDYHLDRTNFTLSGNFSENDIQRAKKNGSIVIREYVNR